MAKNTLRFDLLGASFTISANEEQSYLDSLLNRYKLRLEETKRNFKVGDDNLKTAILTGFVLCDELEILKSGGTQSKTKYEYMKISDKLSDISQRIDNVITEKRLSHEKSEKIPILKNVIKHYDWGSTDWLPEMLGLPNPESVPWAEMWMGTHAGGPSMADTPSGLKPLSEVAGEMPFLFKVIAAGKPLSMQVHPNLQQAAAGFERENAAGIPLEDGKRSYKDPNHKPEIVAALTPFTLMAGFRERSKIVELFDALGCAALLPLRNDLLSAMDDKTVYNAFLRSILTMPSAEQDEVSSYIARQMDDVKARAPEFSAEWELVEEFYTYFQGDISVIAPLYLNVVRLSPGEALFVPPGVLHSYTHGLAVELMSASDNVIRAGLTHKYIDTEGLLNIVDPASFNPSVFKPMHLNYTFAQFYTPVKEWRLSVINVSDGREERLNETNDSIVLITEGEASVVFVDGKGNLRLSKGESAFFSRSVDRGSFFFEGVFTAYIASRGMH